MKRFITFAGMPVLLMVLATSCSEDDPLVLPVPPVLSDYEDLTQKDHVLFNLEKSYNKMDENEFLRLLAPQGEYTFYFSQKDIDDGFVQATTWDRDQEANATKNMFNKEPSADEGFIIDRIDLRLDYLPGEDEWVKDAGGPGNHEGEDWYERNVIYNMTVKAGDETFVGTDISTHITVKQISDGGRMLWKIVEWRDGYYKRPKKEGASGRGQAGTTGTHSATWGAVKSMFGESDPGKEP